MKIKGTVITCLILTAGLFLLLAGCRGGASTVTTPTASVVYLKNNIHVQQHESKNEYKASYANWTEPGRGHIIIPVNSPVTMEGARRGLIMKVQNRGISINFEIDEKNIGMSSEQYWQLITSPQPTNIDRLSPTDRRGIQDGKAYKGMTKEGVRIALGYPAPHRTPSLDGNTWVFWTNRWRAIEVDFDNHGKVKNIR